MAPVLLHSKVNGAPREAAVSTVEAAWETQAAWRHGHCGLKSAPRHRDFRPGKVGVN